ncbi:dihydropteroate synthase [Fulvivirga sp. M361]|nr:dihydropteroate synthase [Fulvivirga sp. M361]
MILNIRGNLVILDSPKVMGIINATPDSFYHGSRSLNETEVLKKTELMASEGAFIIDIGGYSSRPGADDLTEEEELNRVLPHIANIRKRFPELYISIDTFRSKVAKEAILNGADVVNDISGGELDSIMFDTVAELQVPYVMMHMKGTPQDMNKQTNYKDLLADIFLFFQRKVTELRQKGLKDIIIDPGFGFAKTMKQNYQVLGHLEFFKTLSVPLLVGLSRKSMIYKALETTPEEALNGTTALNMVSLLRGADILRVHDVKEAMETVKLFNLTYNN